MCGNAHLFIQEILHGILDLRTGFLGVIVFMKEKVVMPAAKVHDLHHIGIRLGGGIGNCATGPRVVGAIDKHHFLSH